MQVKSINHNTPRDNICQHTENIFTKNTDRQIGKPIWRIFCVKQDFQHQIIHKLTTCNPLKDLTLYRIFSGFGRKAAIKLLKHAIHYFIITKSVTFLDLSYAIFSLNDVFIDVR